MKLKWDPRLGLFVYDRALTLGLAYPYDWGFVPGTAAADGDPLDAVSYAGTRVVPRRLQRELEEFFVVASKGTAKTVHVEGFAGPKAARRAIEAARVRAERSA